MNRMTSLGISGMLVFGVIILFAGRAQADGTKKLYKMTFTPLENGDVRQFIEESLDGGKSWHVWFDGTYRWKSSSRIGGK